MKLAVMTDVHANLPALEAALAEIRRLNVDKIIHTGDAIGLGPYPAETLDLLLAQPDIRFVMGNHDKAYAFGLPDPPPKRYGPEELAHFEWTFEQIDPALKPVMQSWPYSRVERCNGTTMAFAHYGLTTEQDDWVPLVDKPNPQALDRMFAGLGSDVVFYGHHHPRSDLRGWARYVNPGSLGCDSAPMARFMIIEVFEGGYHLTHHTVRYDDRALFMAFETRGVPDRTLIYRIMFGGRFPL